MSAVVARRAAVPMSVDARDRGEYRAALDAISQLSTRVHVAGELADVLRSVAAGACEVLAIQRCAVFVRDGQRELFAGCAAHPGQPLEAAVRRLVLGGPADRFTDEILQTRAPLLIRDAGSDPRASTAAARAWKLRSLLGVPMVADDEILGLLTFDNGSRLHRYAPIDLEIASAFGALAGSLVARTREASGLRSELATATRQNRLLRRTALAEHRLAEATLTGGGLREIVELVCTLTGKPATLYDIDGRAIANGRAAEGGPPVTLLQDAPDDAALRSVLSDVVAGASATVEPAAGSGARWRHLAAPVDVHGERWGWLIMMEHPSRLVAFDDFLIRRAATHIALDLAGRRQPFTSGAEARGLLTREILRGETPDDDLRRSAEYLGVALDAPRIVVCLGTVSDRVDVDGLAAAVGTRVGSDVLAVDGAEGATLLIEIRADEPAGSAVRRVTRCLHDVLRELSPAGLCAGVSGVCRGASELPGGHRVAAQVARCVQTFPLDGCRRVLTADELGPGRLFVANSNLEETERFAEDVLGRLLGDDESCPELLRTLDAFHESGRSVRLASERLGVHENTVRYRLSRVQAISGLDVVADADAQLSVQIALLVLRLRGHVGLRGFDSIIESATEPTVISSIAR